MKIKKEEYLNNPIYGKNIYYHDGYVYCNDKIKDITLVTLKRFIGLFIGIILGITILFLNNSRVKKIVFNAQYPINNLIEEDIFQNTKKLLSWRFLSIKTNDLNHYIRGKYPMYEWIGIKKDNNLLYVSITNNQTTKEESENLNKNIIAKKDGLVKEFFIYKGKNMTSVHKSVKKGDILISNESENTKGYILAETYTIETLKISKKSLKTVLTGQMYKYYALNLFGLKIKINDKKSYDNYHMEEGNIFNVKNIISLSNIYIYEKSDIIDMYAKQEAIDLANNYIEVNFKRTLDKEKILETIILNETETKDYYILEILVKKLENIGEYE